MVNHALAWFYGVEPYAIRGVFTKKPEKITRGRLLAAYWPFGTTLKGQKMSTTPATAKLPTFLSQRQIAELLGASVRTIQTWRSAGKMPPPDVRVGGVLRWRRETVELWLERSAAA